MSICHLRGLQGILVILIKSFFGDRLVILNVSFQEYFFHFDDFNFYGNFGGYFGHCRGYKGILGILEILEVF